MSNDVLSARKLARPLEVTEGTIRRWAGTEPKFPQPVSTRWRGRLATRYWSLAEVRAWLAGYRLQRFDHGRRRVP